MNFDESYGIKKQFSPEEIIFNEGDPSDYMYLVVSGEIEISKTIIDKASRILHTIGENGYFGEMSLITGSKRSATAKAVKDTEVVLIEKQGLMDLLKSDAEFGINLIRQMSERLEKTSESLIFSELELALSRHKPVRFDDTYSGKMLFEVTGYFTIENKSEVTRIAGSLTWSNDVDVIASLFKFEKEEDSLIFIVATDNLNTLLNVTSSFNNLVKWEYVPVIRTDIDPLSI